MTEYEELVASGSFHKWENVGESIEGVIMRFSLDGGTDFNGNACPEVVLNTEHGPVTVTAGQFKLREIFEQFAGRFQPNHKMLITYYDEEDTGKGNKLKLFKVQVAPEPEMDDLTVAPAVEDAGEPF